jgi:hypothetical protein
MATYTKDFLIDCFLHRFIHCSLITIEQLEELEKMANNFFDRVGRDKFRVYCSLDADAIRQYKESV